TGTLKIRQWETEERSGIAPTVVAEHIGTDLRYGTAHYRRSKAPDRAQSQAGPAARETDSSRHSGWDALPDTYADGGTPPAADGSYTAESATGGRPPATAQIPADAEETATARDAAIARDTAEAAAPF